jgi:ABC-2 type transport system ATP-binding protein
MPAHIAVRDLRKRYGAVEALRGVSFDVERGEIFGLLGPNGAGETTTLECLTGLRSPDAGTIEVAGVDVSREPRAARERIGVALQTTALQDKITPREALTLFGAFYRQREKPGALLERFSLSEKADAAFDTLSVGQRQRLALALAFVNRPDLLVLDEPTSGLDPSARRELHGDILRSKEAGKTILLATHDLAEAEQLCDRIAIADSGRVIATGEPRELVAQSSAFQSVRLVTGAPLDRERLAGVAGIVDLECAGTVARFRTADATQTLARLLALLDAARIELRELQVKKATLEEVFLRLTEGKAP